MTSKFIVFATFVIVASPGLLSLAYDVVDPVAYKMHTKAYESEHYDHNPKYSYSYDIVDAHTGDIKSQQETRNGDVVEGSYSFIEADGSRRVVHYTADSLHGFNAIIERQPAEHVAVEHIEPAYSKVALSLVHAPVFYHHATLIVKVADPVNSAKGYSASAVSHTYYH